MPRNKIWLREKVYPVGIPSLYLFILWANRHALNPSVKAHEKDTVGGLETGSSPASSGWMKIGGGGRVKIMTPRESQELEKRISDRNTNPDLTPSMFLWKDFGEMFPWAVYHMRGHMLAR